jgi:hypothetical protein
MLIADIRANNFRSEKSWHDELSDYEDNEILCIMSIATFHMYEKQ